MSPRAAVRRRSLARPRQFFPTDSLAQFLKLAGYQTRVAYDGRKAVEMAEILEPAVVLLDLGLPHLNGHEVARRLPALPWGRSAVLIALTGWGQEDDVQRSRQAGFDEHLTKPVDPEVLLRHIIVLTIRSRNARICRYPYWATGATP